jgi:ABC-type uncharacterized transport system substrate-binding protein
MAKAAARIWVGMVLLSAFCLPCAVGQESSKYPQIIVRTLTFLQAPPRGAGTLGIVFAETSPQSRANAQRLAALFENGVTVGQLTVTPRLLSSGALATAGDLVAVFVEPEAAANTAGLAAAASRLHVPVISTDVKCVVNGGCAVAFSVEDTVRITVNHAACTAAGIAFIQAFRILVSEI